MKIQWLIATGLAFGAGSAIARDTAQDERNILRAESAICDAYESSDTDSLRNRLDDRFTLTDSKGIVTNRDQNLLEVKKRDPVYVVFRNHDQKVRLYGDAAIVTGVTTIQSHSGANKFEGDFEYTDTWVQSDGRWKLAASHASLLRTR